MRLSSNSIAREGAISSSVVGNLLFTLALFTCLVTRPSPVSVESLHGQ